MSAEQRLHTMALPDGPEIDPVALAGADGIVHLGPALRLAGRGVARRLALPGGLADEEARERAVAVLRQLQGEDHVGAPGTGAVACAALPFHPQAPGQLVVPALLYGRDAAGREWVTVPGPPSGPPPPPPEGWRERLLALGAAGAEPATPAVVERTEVPDGAAHVARVAAALEQIRRGQVAKVVLARAVDLRFDGPLDIAAVARRLHAQEPACWTFRHPVPGGAFVGASPELLVAREGATVSSHPLAGTTGLAEPGAPPGPSAGDPGAGGGRGGTSSEGAVRQRLLGSRKELEEHRLAVEQIVSVLGPVCAHLTVPERPSLVRLGSVAHLGTAIQGQLAPTSGGLPHALDLLAALHPTPAVGGVPRAEALAVIAELEGQPRDRWAGPVGWVDSRGDGELVLGLRSVTIRSNRARLWAGGGIVAGSDPEAELAETTLKLEPVLRALTASPPGPGSAPAAPRS